MPVSSQSVCNKAFVLGYLRFDRPSTNILQTLGLHSNNTTSGTLSTASWKGPNTCGESPLSLRVPNTKRAGRFAVDHATLTAPCAKELTIFITRAAAAQPKVLVNLICQNSAQSISTTPQKYSKI